MKRYGWGLIALLDPVPGAGSGGHPVLGAGCAGSARPGEYSGAAWSATRSGLDRSVTDHSRLTPEDVRRQKETTTRSRSVRPVVPEREAVLPDPSDGRELVDRYVAAGSERPIRQIVPAGESGGQTHLLKSANHRSR